ncbi:MAG: diguanylate cyclase (GGDEF)-like protein [Verrucomicrobiales bacterium]|jgi:diguanylate cyclase (GGDEF)-like protein
MDEDARITTIAVIASIVAATSALIVFVSPQISVASMGVLWGFTILWLLGQHRQLNDARAELVQYKIQRAHREPVVEKLTTSATDQLRDDESRVLEQIAGDGETVVVLNSITKMLANRYPGCQFRIVNDDLFAEDVVDRTWTILPRTDKEVGWILQANLSEQGAALEAEVIGLAQDLGRLALDKARSRTNLVYQADHDALTGLLSRRAVLSTLDEAILTNKSVGLVYCDIDKFKDINDTLGHQAGDDLLCGIGERLLEAADQSPFKCKVGRLGGDEYLIVACGAARTAMIAFVESLSFAIRAPFTFDGRTIATSLSLGATFIEERTADALSPESAELLKESDLALYQVKRTGRNSFRFFDDDLRAILDDQRELQNDLAKSISSRSGIHAMFQPQFGPDRKLVGFEALGRWYRQGLGLVPPDEFLGVATEHGLMADFDLEVFSHVSHVMGTLRREGRNFGSVSINVSAERLETPNFVQSTLDLLRRNSIDPRTVVLEITESSLLQDLHERGKHLEQLRAWGVRIAIDDFGTGYSSLSYLRELPVDIVKLDKDFVSDIDRSEESRAIVQAILTLARALDLDVVAEGVERESQFSILNELGCTIFQGFLLGRPLVLDVARSIAQDEWPANPFASTYDWSDRPPTDASTVNDSTVVFEETPRPEGAATSGLG